MFGLILALLTSVLVGILPFERALAQNLPHVPEWSPSAELFEVATDYGLFDPVIISDQTGTVHAVWREVAITPGINEALIYYARLENGVWSLPVDIVASPESNLPTMGIDSTGNMHLLWAAGRMLHYTHAPVANALSAQNWAEPIVLDEANLRAQIKVDRQDQLHVVYARPDSDGPYHIVSRDLGNTWSPPINIASARVGSLADFVRLSITAKGILHVVWTEFALPDGWPPTGLYYSHSLDGGTSWSAATQLAGGGFNQINIVALDDDSVHVVWNGMAGIQGRYHRWSADGGDTWSDTTTINTASGSSGLPPIIADSTGVVHIVITGNDPLENNCLLYISWRNQQWTEPKCISAAGSSPYLEEPAMTLAGGNQLHALYWTDRQFLWHVASEIDAPPIASSPYLSATPASEIQMSQLSTPTPIFVETQRQSTFSRDIPVAGKPVNPNAPLIIGMAAASLFTVLALMFKLIHQRKH